MTSLAINDGKFKAASLCRRLSDLGDLRDALDRIALGGSDEELASCRELHERLRLSSKKELRAVLASNGCPVTMAELLRA